MTSKISIYRRSQLMMWPAVLALLLAGVIVGKGNIVDSGEEWRPIDPSDLALKTPMVEPDADAEAIFWDIRVDEGDGDDVVLSNYVRIKIFTDRGRELESKINIPFLTGTRIKDVAARVIKPDGSIFELAKDDIIEKIVIKISGLKLRTKSFVLPGLAPGVIVEYKWKEVYSHSTANNMRLEFQREIPVQSVTYHIRQASWNNFDVYPFNMPRPVIQEEKKGFHSVSMTKLPAFHEEPLMPPEDNVRAWAMVKYNDAFSLIGYKSLAAEAYVIFQPLLKVDDDVKRKATEIIAGATTPEDKLERIFIYCRTSIRNTSDKTLGFTADDLEKLKVNKKPADTLARGIGYRRDINLLFAALANAAGFDARVVFLPDRGQRFFERALVIPGALRPANIAVRLGNTWKFFDPGFHFITNGMLRWQEEGVDALIADPSPVWVSTPISAPEKSKETRVATLRMDESGTLEGDISVQDTGHLALEKKELYEDDSPNQRETDFKEAIKSRLSTAEVTNIVIENVTDPARPFAYKYHVRIPEYAQRTGKRVFLQPAYFQKGVGALFASSARRHPIYFHFPWSEEDKVTIWLPKGFAPDNPDVPAPITVGNLCRYAVKMGMNKDQSVVVYSRSFSFGNEKILLFPADGYAQIKRLFDEINKSDNHIIALKPSAPAN